MYRDEPFTLDSIEETIARAAAIKVNQDSPQGHKGCKPEHLRAISPVPKPKPAVTSMSVADIAKLGACHG